MNKKIYIPPVTVSAPAGMVPTILAGSQSPMADSKEQDFFDEEEEQPNPWSSANKADGWRDAYNPW